MTNAFTLSYSIIQNDFINAGNAASEIRKILKKLGLNKELIRRIAIAAYEGEINVVIHSHGGNIKLEILPTYIDLVIKDNGPGIDDIEQAMSLGYSTASNQAREFGFGAGMGLPNMKKVSDKFTITSNTKGTFIKMRYYLN